MNLTEDAYHSYPAWSYSIIAKYAKEGFTSIAHLHEPTVATPSMEFGSLFDSIITKGRKTLDEYSVCDVTVPDAERKAIDYIVSHTDKPHARLAEIAIDDFMRYCDAAQYQGRWGYDARLKHLLPYEKYYDIKRCGKIPVSKDDWEDAMEMYRAFYANKCVKAIFGTKDTKDIEYIYQAQFCEDYEIDFDKSVPIKIMPDLIIVNHKEKMVQLVDLKTSFVPAHNFSENFVKYRYDIQASLYSDIMELVLNKIPEYSDYTVVYPYLFTDISRSDKVPVTYKYDPRNGFSFKNYSYKGWEELLKEIISYEESNAQVPNYISLEEPNDIIEILNR